jgi:DNA-directed RNA polymerase specialized sigma subunit
MTAKQYLRQLARLQLNIKILTEELEERRTRLTSTAAPVLGDKVQSTPKGDAFAAAMAAIADKDIQRQELVFIYEQQRDRIVGQIIELPNPLQARVLYDRYVQNRTLVQIADATHYSYTRICHVHGQALADFFRLYLQDDNK